MERKAGDLGMAHEVASQLLDALVQRHRRREEPRDDLGEALHHRAEQRVARVEVLIRRRAVDARTVCDLGDGKGLRAALGSQRKCRLRIRARFRSKSRLRGGAGERRFIARDDAGRLRKLQQPC